MNMNKIPNKERIANDIQSYLARLGIVNTITINIDRSTYATTVFNNHNFIEYYHPTLTIVTKDELEDCTVKFITDKFDLQDSTIKDIGINDKYVVVMYFKHKEAIVVGSRIKEDK